MELLVVLAIVGLLAGLLMAGASKGRAAARRAQCFSQLRQLGLAAQLYWDDHQGLAFRFRETGTGDGPVYWFGRLSQGAEGRRLFDPRSGPLAAYAPASLAWLCPAFDYGYRRLKLKATEASVNYGYNLRLSAPPTEPLRNIAGIESPSRMVVFADAAQVNTFQSPASPSNPLLEEFYYVSDREPTTHYRHEQRSLGGFSDGHAEWISIEPARLDRRLIDARVGPLPSPAP